VDEAHTGVVVGMRFTAHRPCGQRRAHGDRGWDRVPSGGSHLETDVGARPGKELAARFTQQGIDAEQGWRAIGANICSNMWGPGYSKGERGRGHWHVGRKGSGSGRVGVHRSGLTGLTR
jgi:hypothetical protein